MRSASAAAPARRRELRGDLDTILAKACAADPSARHTSAAALRDDLQRHLNNEPIVARPASAWYRLSKLIRRRPLESATVAAVVLAVPAGAHVQAAVLLSLGIGTGLALWQMRSAQKQTGVARAEQQRVEAVKEFIASTFGQAVPRDGAGASSRRATCCTRPTRACWPSCAITPRSLPSCWRSSATAFIS
jgi:serine/threonine-protein kinase